ncbi:Maf family protein [Alishewanella jeotgali]|uniref:dTTP/UTP pyrophosphatase n=1 Tax=Alishewanella jeotgali KCTC 22429 TaxID=1129374 RepID=H3ZFD5_9ALTE|nr:Maf family protein [Alishewanella jeotgali]EHR40696.1 Maf-like protein [Alishewanella jeotgali KCTC 22429]
MYPDIALASASPRRRELLAQLPVNFTLVSAEIDESVLAGEEPASYVSRLALQKAQAGANKLNWQLPVLGADTSVILDKQILGKPESKAHFMQMLRQLSGRSHQVLTAVAIVSAGQQLQALSSTEVWLRPLSDTELDAYWQSGEPADKAGGYGIQGLAARFVEKIHGSYTGVVGLPLCETERLIQQLRRSA